MQGGQQHRSMWQQLMPRSKLWHQQVVGALQQLLPSASSSIRYWRGFCREFPAGSNRFKKSTAVTATAMLLTTFIYQKPKF